MGLVFASANTNKKSRKSLPRILKALNAKKKVKS